MKIKYFLFCSLAGIGLAGCVNDVYTTCPDERTEADAQGTFMRYSILPLRPGTRADLPTTIGQEKDYNIDNILVSDEYGIKSGTTPWSSAFYIHKEGALDAQITQDKFLLPKGGRFDGMPPFQLLEFRNNVWTTDAWQIPLSVEVPDSVAERYEAYLSQEHNVLALANINPIYFANTALAKAIQMKYSDFYQNGTFTNKTMDLVRLPFFVTERGVMMVSDPLERKTLTKGISKVYANSDEAGEAQNHFTLNLKRVVAKGAVAVANRTMEVRSVTDGLFGTFTADSFEVANVPNKTYVFDKEELTPKDSSGFALWNYRNIFDYYAKRSTGSLYNAMKPVPVNLNSVPVDEMNGVYFFDNFLQKEKPANELTWGNTTHFVIKGKFTPNPSRVRMWARLWNTDNRGTGAYSTNPIKLSKADFDSLVKGKIIGNETKYGFKKFNVHTGFPGYAERYYIAEGNQVWIAYGTGDLGTIENQVYYSLREENVSLYYGTISKMFYYIKSDIGGDEANAKKSDAYVQYRSDGRAGYRIPVNVYPANADFNNFSHPVEKVDVKRNNFYVLRITGYAGMPFNFDDLNPNDPYWKRESEGATDGSNYGTGNEQFQVTPESKLNNNSIFLRFTPEVKDWSYVHYKVIGKWE